MTIVKKIIKHIDGKDYETLVTRGYVLWTFFSRPNSRFALNLTPESPVVLEIRAAPRLVLKLIKVL